MVTFRQCVLLLIYLSSVVLTFPLVRWHERFSSYRSCCRLYADHTNVCGLVVDDNSHYIPDVKLFPYVRVAGNMIALLVSVHTAVLVPSPVWASSVPLTQGKQVLEGEASRIFMKARSVESDGDFLEAQRLYQEVISVEPTSIYSWANLGNVLVSEGILDQALLCYKKAISLQPPKDQLAIILLNKASLELSIGR